MTFPLTWLRTCVLSVLFMACASAQFESASLKGSVLNESGKPLGGATVSASNENTGAIEKVTADASGFYLFPSLRPGSYFITVRAIGYKQLIIMKYSLQVNQAARLDLPLDASDSDEPVYRAATQTLLDTESSSRGAVVNQQNIAELPLNGRDYNQLALLTPGVSSGTPRLLSIGFRGAFNVNGNRAFQNAFQLDGVDNTSYSNSFRGNNMQVIQPSMEALQEFKMQTNAYSAEFGRSAGALVNAITRSGANAMHASAYEYHRNDNLDASNFFTNRNGLDRPARLRNQFGGAIGGHILPNRTFFFGDYEGQRSRESSVRTSSVPQTIWKQGLFTMPIYNPYNPKDTGDDFRIPATAACNDGKGNCWQIPRSLIDPVGERILGVSPAPTVGTPGQIDNNFVAAPLDRNRSDQFDLRLDHNLPRKAMLFGRYSFSDTNMFRPSFRPGLSEGSSNDNFGAALWRSQAIMAGATWTVGPTLLSETRIGWMAGNLYQLPVNAGSGCPDQLVGLKGGPTDETLCGGLPPINFNAVASRRIGRTTSEPQYQTPRGLNVRESFAWTARAHTLKFGGEFVQASTGIRDISALIGNFDFTGRFTGESGQYQGAVADLLLGFPTRYQQDSDTVFHLFQNMYFTYLQDYWKAASWLTISAGLRYEFATPTRDRDLKAANFDPASGQFLQAKHGSLLEESLLYPDRNNFAPRLGLAATVTRTTVMRAAYGVFYNHTNRQGREGLLGFNPPFVIQADKNISGSQTLRSSDAIFRLQDGIPSGLVDLNKLNLSTVARKAQDMHQRSPYVQQWNFGVQQELPGKILVDLAYVGNRGLKLPAFRNLNQAAVVFSSQGVPSAGARPLASLGLNGSTIQYLEDIGKSNYNSLQAKVEGRFANGSTYLVAYTWGNTLANSVDHLSTQSAGAGVDLGVFKEPQSGLDRRQEYGPAEFDVKHRLTAAGVFQLPGRSLPKHARGIFGDWELSPILTTQTGLPLTVTQSELLSLGGERRSRPTRLANGTLDASLRNADRWFDTAAFQILQVNPALAGFIPNRAFGNSGIGILRAPGLIDLDLNLSKTIRVSESGSIQVRGEFFNALNHTNLGVPGTNMGAGFGQIVNTATEARIIQCVLRFRF
jgi:hypothetical protein